MIFQTDTTNEPLGVDELAEQTGDFFGEIRTMLENGWAAILENGPEWAIGLGIIAVLYILFRVLRASVSGVLSTKSKPANAVRNVAARLISGTNSILMLLAALALAGPFVLPMSDRLTTFLRTTLIIVFIIQIALWAKVVASAVLTRVAEKHSSDQSTLANALSLLTLFANAVIFAIAGMMVLDNVGVDVTALIAGLGVGGIAIALAAQNIFKDLFASLSIVLDRPFVKQDVIKFGDKIGTVQKIGLKTTRVQALSGEQVIVGNNQLLEQDVQNYRRMSERRIVFNVGVTYQTQHSALQQIPGFIKDIIDDTEGVRFDRSHMAAFADSSINFETVYYVLTREYGPYMDVQQKILLGIHKKFEDEGIDFAYPTRTLWMAGNDDSAAPETKSDGNNGEGADAAAASRTLTRRGG